MLVSAAIKQEEVPSQRIKISGNAPATSTYVGASECLGCHEEQKNFTKTLHRLGITVIGKSSKLQDYWMNDITSYLYSVPRKDNKGVNGLESGKAMPIPYTQPCGAACHDTRNL
ncbi:MAG: hypothetical protein NT159_06520 [Proteobacteria bacterium]|nr:hypothetical protein [Pseudomonadota bacterium]